ncbi:protein Wnt-6 [Carlito syrichta]|uniref:Protein Wnt n=1 Tax=Carlito syrichta TaxID=1868482 RepID=A0A3Q0DWC6_CARSF|nr:protein Wnt-6 [Carlito syrichta]
MDPTSICRKARRLAGRQAELCQAEPEVVAELARGARLGVRECQFQFRFRRWNCSSHSKAFGRILQQDIRETAFVFAITAAGASHAVTQACSMGELLQCGCQAPRGRAPPRPSGLPGTPGPPGSAGSLEGSAAWEWGGCGDDVDFGDEKSRLFMDARHKRGRGDIRALVQLHNNEAGRLAVRSHTRTECKCHGLSGSCALRTCWQKLSLVLPIPFPKTCPELSLQHVRPDCSPYSPTPTPSSLKPLIPDSCGGCRQRWGKEGGYAGSLLLLRPPPPPDSLGTRKAPPLCSNSPGMGNSRNGPLLSLSPEALAVQSLSQEGLSSERGGRGAVPGGAAPWSREAGAVCSGSPDLSRSCVSQPPRPPPIMRGRPWLASPTGL